MKTTKINNFPKKEEKCIFLNLNKFSIFAKKEMK
jgi:hypothetical protein